MRHKLRLKILATHLFSIRRESAFFSSSVEDFNLNEPPEKPKLYRKLGISFDKVFWDSKSACTSPVVILSFPTKMSSISIKMYLVMGKVM